MFGKTLLSIVGLLFAGSKFVSAEAITFKDIPVCGDAYEDKAKCEDSGNAETYCYRNNKLFGFSSDNEDKSKCDTVLQLTSERINIVTLGDAITPVTLASIGSAYIDTVAIYDCDATSCQRVTGLVKKEGVAEYYMVGTGSGVDTPAVLNSDTEYLVFDGTGAIAYSKQEDSFAKNASRDGDNLCVDGSSVLWETRKKALCGADSDCSYYDCKDGVCTLTRVNTLPKSIEGGDECDPATCTDDKCAAGYHLVGGNTLYYCDGSTGCGKAALTEENIPIGYLVNADGGYIECKFNAGSRVCSAAVPTAAGCQTVGGLHTTSDGTVFNLCLDTTNDISVDLTTNTDVDGAIDSAGKYMIALGTTGLFGVAGRADAAYYLTVEVDGDGNVTVLKEADSVRYRYTATDATTHTSTLYQVYDRATAQGKTSPNDICDASGAKPFEFKLVQWTLEPAANDAVDYYIEGDNTDLS